MDDQLRLPWAVDPLRVYEDARCCFGQPTMQHGRAPNWDGPDHCAGCAAESARLGAAFDALVASGYYDAEGYSVKERKAQAKKRTTC